MQCVFFGKHSIVAAIENSFLFKNRFEHHVSRSTSEVKSVVRSLSLAKQRFDSTQKPIGRFVLWFFPLLQTIVEISRERRGEDSGDKASAFLAYITEEIVLQIAMLADAGDEGEQLVRQFDSESAASEEIGMNINNFLTKVCALFVSDEPVCVLTGYTRHMIDMLSQREILLPSLDGRGVRGIGGPNCITAEILDRCLGRMKVWVRLCQSVISHEFPEWDVLASFSILQVAGNQRDGMTNEVRDLNIRRLARFFSLEEALLRSELEDLAVLARNHASATSCDSVTAWQHTLQRVRATKKRRDRHPCSTLLTVLSRWVAWTPSTSGVEQAFGHGTHFQTARQSHASEASECRDMVLLLDHDPQTEDQQIRLAQQVQQTYDFKLKLAVQGWQNTTR